MSRLIDELGALPAITDLVKKYGIRNLVETGTGPESSGLQVAANLGLKGYSCDVFYPCVRDAKERFPDATVLLMESLGFLSYILDHLKGPTFFWLDGHCPTDRECLPGPIYPPFEELEFLRQFKTDYQGDVFWLDDFSMVDVSDNPIAASWDVDLAGTRWQGAKEHTFAEYVALLDATHTHEIVGPVLRFTPR